MPVKGQGSEWGLKRGQPGAVGAGWSHRFYTVNIEEPLGAFIVPRGAVFVGVPFSTNAIKLSVIAKPEAVPTEAPAMVDAGSAVVLADGFSPSRPVQNGEVVVIEHDDGVTDIGAISFVLEGKDLPATLTILPPAA